MSEQATVTAPAGATLVAYSAPPMDTVTMVIIPKGFDSALYRIRFEPYGWSSAGTTGGQLFVRVESSKPLDAAAKRLAKDWGNTNLSVFVGSVVAGQLATGGTFTGTLQVQPRASVGVLALLDAKHD